jgi:hypothetical protein
MRIVTVWGSVKPAGGETTGPCAAQHHAGREDPAADTPGTHNAPTRRAHSTRTAGVSIHTPHTTGTAAHTPGPRPYRPGGPGAACNEGCAGIRDRGWRGACRGGVCGRGGPGARGSFVGSCLQASATSLPWIARPIQPSSTPIRLCMSTPRYVLTCCLPGAHEYDICRVGWSTRVSDSQRPGPRHPPKPAGSRRLVGDISYERLTRTLRVCHSHRYRHPHQQGHTPAGPSRPRAPHETEQGRSACRPTNTPK